LNFMKFPRRFKRPLLHWRCNIPQAIPVFSKPVSKCKEILVQRYAGTTRYL